MVDSQDQMRVEPIQHVPSLRQRVHERLEAMIIGGILSPGDRLVETDLAELLGVSRGPVREALQLLDRDGWVDLRARQGAFVHVPTDKEIDDFYGLRRVLEMEAARLAAQKATAEDHERLRALVRQGLELLAADRDPFEEMEPGAVHGTIARIADNDDLTEVLGRLSKRGRWYVAPLKVTRREHEWEEHSLIIDAIVAGDAARAAEEMGGHVARSRDAFKAIRAANGS